MIGLILAALGNFSVMTYVYDIGFLLLFNNHIQLFQEMSNHFATLGAFTLILMLLSLYRTFLGGEALILHLK